MLRGFTHQIDQAAAHVPAVLWSADAMREMKRLVERFPEARMRSIGPARLGIMGLELRLGGDSPQVDLTFPVLREDRDVIVAMGSAEEDGAWMRAHPAWSRVWALCRAWADPDTRIGRHVELLWLELDVVGGGAGVPAPGVYVGFKPGTTGRLSAGEWRALLAEVVDALTGAPAPDATLDHFARAVAEMPPGAFVRFFGFMLSRGASVARIVVGRGGEGWLPAMLKAIGWPGPADAPEARARELAGTCSALQYDVADGSVLPRIGLELDLDLASQAAGEIAERELLDRLVARRLCDPDKRDALLLLPGEETAPYKDVCLLGHSRKVHHLKLVMDAAGVHEAKAYYGRALLVRPLGNAPAGAA